MQNGNALFIILIAVALFAALSFAITRTTSGVPSVKQEGSEISAARIIQFSTLLQEGVQRLITLNSVKITDLKFNNDIYKTKGGTLIMGTMGAPANPALYVFHPRGGNVMPQTFIDIIKPCTSCGNGSTTPGHATLYWENIQQNGTSTADPTLLIQDLTDEICLALNNKLGITIIPTLTVSGDDFMGTADIPPSVSQPTGSAANLAAIKGKASFCFKQSSSSRNIFMHSLQVN